MRRKDVKSIDEMIENKFTVYMSKMDFSTIKNFEFAHRLRWKEWSQTDKTYEAYKILVEGANTGIVLDSNELDILVKISKKNNYTILDEKIISDVDGFVLQRNNFMFQIIDKKVVQFFEAGIMKKFMDEFSNPYWSRKEIKGPVVFTLDHLGIGFKICFFCASISLLVFFLEFFPRLLRTVVGHFTIETVMRRVVSRVM